MANKSFVYGHTENGCEDERNKTRITLISEVNGSVHTHTHMYTKPEADTFHSAVTAHTTKLNPKNHFKIYSGKMAGALSHSNWFRISHRREREREPTDVAGEQ